jgi:hypothetical protein
MGRYLIIILAGNSYSRGGLSTVDLLVKLGCFVKKKIKVSVSEGANLN